MELGIILVVAAGCSIVSAVIASLICKTRFVQGEASLQAQRDSALKTVEERGVTLAEAKQAHSDTVTKHETALALVASLEFDKGRLQGELASMVTLRTQIVTREEKIEQLNARIVDLESAKAELLERTESAEKSKQEAIAAKDAHLQATLEAQSQGFREKMAEKENSLAQLIQSKNESHEEQKRLLTETEKILTDKFGAVSLESLKAATAEFLKLANERFDKVGELSKADLEKRQEAIDQLLKPVAETLDKLDKQHKEMEEKRVSAFDSIEKGIKTLSEEADQLANALRKPTSRGAWGEMNLHVILENAGLVEGEHFDLQDTTVDGDERRLRTDVVIHLPNGRDVIIDSKAPLESFWEGMNAPDEATRQIKFQAHARLVRDHVKTLTSKAYWSRYKASPDCVVMFIPTEGAYQAAIESDRALMTDAHQGRVYLANPMTIINMIHLTAYILKEERLKTNAQEVQEVASELYKRLAKFVGDISSMGKSLRVTVNHYNSAVGALDGRLLPQARKISQLGAGSGDNLTDLPEIEVFPRGVLSQELADLADVDQTRSDVSILHLSAPPDPEIAPAM